MKRAQLGLFLVLIVVLSGCLNLSKKTLSWEADYQIPLTVSQTTAADILTSNEIQNDGNKFFISQTQAGTVDLGLAGLTINDIQKTVTENFPVINLGKVVEENIGFMIPLMGSSSSEQFVKTININEFEEVIVKSGLVSLSATNGISSTSSISFTAALRFSNGVTMDFTYDGLAPGTSQIVNVPLDGNQLGNVLDVVIKNYQVNGSGVANVGLENLSVEISSLSSVKGYDININSTVEETLTFDQSEYNVTKFQLAAGQLAIGINLPGGLTATVDSLKIGSQQLDKIGTNTFSLANQELDNNAVMTANVTVTSDPAVNIILPDQFTAIVDITGIDLASATLTSPEIALGDNYSFELPVLELQEPLNKVRLDGAELSLTINQTMGSLDYSNFKLLVVKNDDSSYEVKVASLEVTPSGDKLTFNQSDVKILLNDIIAGNVRSSKITGSLKSAGDIVITTNNSIGYQADIFVPVKLDGNQSIAYTPTEQLEAVILESKAKELIKNAVGNVKLIAEVDNGLPIGTNISLDLADDRNNLITTLTGQVVAATTDGNGLAIAPVKSEVFLELSKTHIDSLVNAPSFLIKPTIYIEVPANGAFFAPSNTIKIRALLVVKTQVKVGV